MTDMGCWWSESASTRADRRVFLGLAGAFRVVRRPPGLVGVPGLRGIRLFQVVMTQPAVVRDRPVAVSCRRLMLVARSLSHASFFVTPM